MFDEVAVLCGPSVPIQAERLKGARIAVIGEVPLAGNDVELAVFVEIHQRNGMRLRPTVVDQVLFPLAGTQVLRPVKAEAMAGAIDEVWFSVTIDVMHENRTGEAVGRHQQKVGMKFPVGASRIGGSLKPAIGGDDVRPPVSVNVARADPVQSVLAGNGADLMADPLAFGKRLYALQPCYLAARAVIR